MRPLFLVLLGLLWLLSGCGPLRQAAPVDGSAVEVELTTVPFFPQEKYQCGPAALATLLVGSDVPTLPDLLSPALYIPKRHGTLQLEIVASIRSHDRIAYQLHPELDAITAELKANRPVLVLQNLGWQSWPVYHYAVVVGLLTDGSLILRSGTTERLISTQEDFLASWQKAGSWAMVALKGGELPADDDIEAYLSTVARIETIGNVELAEDCYRAVLARYPDNDTALFGLANTMFFQADYAQAASFYSQLLRLEPTRAAAANNLAESLAAMHCYELALELLDRFLQPPLEQSRLTAILARTWTKILVQSSADYPQNSECANMRDLIVPTQAPPAAP
ncbi:MAG: PA2778 family cysteine peptidase [Desulfopila sp.]